MVSYPGAMTTTPPVPNPADPDLDHLRDCPPAEAAAELERDLAAAGAPAAASDRAAVELLVDRRAGDPILEHLGTGFLGDLFDRIANRLDGPEPDPDDVRAARAALDVVRRPQVLRRAAVDDVDRWSGRMLRLVEGARFTFPRLFAQRRAGSGSRPLFLLPKDGRHRSVSWHQVGGRIDLIARGLLSVTDGGRERVAVLSHNRLEMALVDLACLASGIVDVLVPATSSEADVAYILRHSGARAAVVSDGEQLAKILRVREQAPRLETVVAMDPAAAERRGVIALDELLARPGAASDRDLEGARERVGIDDLATVMYTSGTTGTPKGICFSHRNIVFKRFARALALPEIGEDDRFLCYLPLFHTFGRFLEMTGCVFWGATYCFAESPAAETLSRQMRQLEPSVFISIPLKWMQLYDLVRAEVDVETAPDDAVEAALRAVVGPRLRWGLSAAGYLDPDIFRFFQRYGVELMSGFGMTEATGGITMTPPGRYREDSLGMPLPGIEARLAGDGELLVRGPYVMTGYLDPPDGERSFDDDGWFHTGDLMEQDAEGAFRIVDRKKEIYKNVKGQTIAPQKIENLFRDFESVGRIFLVGDHRPYNTALIWPNREFEELDLSRLPPDELKAHFRSLVVSANAFLAPYERIVDFAVVDRDLEAARDELTAKGTVRRRVVERSFADEIRLLYRRTTLAVGGAEVTVPNWLFQALGITTQELEVHGDRLRLASLGTELQVRRERDDEIRVGSVCYRHRRAAVDLGDLMGTPRLWIGNEALVDFAPLAHHQRDRRRRRSEQLEWVGRTAPYRPAPGDRKEVEELLLKREPDLADLHRAALMLAATEHDDAILAVRALEHLLSVVEGEPADHALRILRRAPGNTLAQVSRRAFQVLALAERPSHARRTIARYLDGVEALLDAETRAVLVERGLSPATLEALVAETEARCRDLPPGARLSETTTALLEFLADYGAVHPSTYRPLRTFVTRLATGASDARVRQLAVEARTRLENGFRAWIGGPSRIAVDPETGLEYRWDDVVTFADDVDDDARRRLLAAFTSTPILREGVFLFSGGPVVRLDDILPQGVWIRLLGTDHGKSVYRVAVKTRQREQYDLAVNLNRTLSPDEIREEIDWLVVCSDARQGPPLVEEFGGYWPEHGLWTEEFIAGEPLDRALRRLSRRAQDRERYTGIWPFAAWSALSAYVDFWDRTGRRLVIADPTAGNVVVPMHDYHTGARLVSVALRSPFRSTWQLLCSLRDTFLAGVEAEHPDLEGVVGWDVVASSVLEVVGEEEGLQLIRTAAGDAREAGEADAAGRLAAFAEAVEGRGFLPRRLFFAAKRYRRWRRLASDATLDACARTLHEVYRTYGLDELVAVYPEARARFFRETVFRDAGPPLADGLEEIIGRLRRREINPDELGAAVADLRAHLRPGPEDDYFLARLSFPYLRPEDEAAYVEAEAGGTPQSEMVVTYDDREGRAYRIRHALSPKEVARLHRLFLAAKLPVQFRPEHRFLVALTDRGHVIGGLFYEVQPDSHAAHMDKVVVAEAFQGQGIAGALLEELANRLRSAGFRSLTTGFFRPQFFYRYGFTVERRYAGLVRSLTGDEPEG